MYNLGTEKVVIAVDYNDVERIIQNEYGFDEFSIPCNEEKGNDATIEIHVNGKVSSYEQEDIELRHQPYMTRTYMNDLARRGLIKKGIYMIDVSW